MSPGIREPSYEARYQARYEGCPWWYLASKSPGRNQLPGRCIYSVKGQREETGTWLLVFDAGVWVSIAALEIEEDR
jgi:hypothetical protein